MSIGKFEYLAPRSLDEAIELLKEYGPRARVMAGGTDLLLKIRQKAVSPEAVISLKKIKGLDAIDVDPQNGLTIGATALLADVAAHPDIHRYFPAVVAAAKETANVQIRNMGTVVGNICNASPSADNAPTLLVMDASVRITGPRGNRDLPLNDFFKGPGITALEPDEIVTAIFIPKPPAGTGVFYVGFSGRGKLDCATVGVGALMTMAEDVCITARIAIGACAPVPMRAPETESMLMGKTIDDKLLRSASRKASKETSPIDDVRASAAYRLKVTEVVTYRTLAEAGRLARQ